VIVGRSAGEGVVAVSADEARGRQDAVGLIERVAPALVIERGVDPEPTAEEVEATGQVEEGAVVEQGAEEAEEEKAQAPEAEAAEAEAVEAEAVEAEAVEAEVGEEENEASAADR